MRIRRITIEHFRGVDAATINFASGITIVEGPNEAGKSTIAEAISLLFDHLDSSKRQEVRAVQQIGSDIGPCVELEFTVGEYDVTYAKRFLRRPSTMLSIAAPRPEQISGREAHDRMVTICKETLDDALWSAMRVAQGASLDQPDLADVGVLRAALDESGAADGESDLDLLGRVGDEYARYFTPRTGQPTGELSEAVGAQVAAQETYDRVAAELDTAEADVSRSAAVDTELDRLAEESAEHASRLADLRRQARALESLRTAHADAVTALETATTRLRVAGDSVAERSAMVAEATERTETAERIDGELVQLRAEAE
ncbi:MAG: AAA family ATPase, partial [Actinomycetia bacterium]|nr:AAA family ATPase [Actinomycetes bacterium]